MLIVVNAKSNSGNGLLKWELIEKKLRKNQEKYNAVFTSDNENARNVICQAMKDGHKHFVAAGGDGTVNSVLNSLIDPETDQPFKDVTLGAIGLGSSNDFQKPFDDREFIDGIPLRVKNEKTCLSDIGKVEFKDTNDMVHKRYFIINSSIGLIANGNAFFNGDNIILKWLKRKNVDAAIMFTTLIVLMKNKAVNTKLVFKQDGGNRFFVTNLSILKNVHFAGDMLYDTPVKEDDGMFAINLWENMGRFRILKTTLALYKGKFKGLARTRTWQDNALKILPEKPVFLEVDGETYLVKEASFTIIPKAINVCG